MDVPYKIWSLQIFWTTCLISFIFQNVDTLKMDEKEKANSVTIDAEAETQSQSNLENQSQSGSVIENQEQAGAELIWIMPKFFEL